MQQLHEESSAIFFVAPQCKMRPAGRKPGVVTPTSDNNVSAEIVANFLDRGFLT